MAKIFGKVEWKYVEIKYGELYVVISGPKRMLTLLAGRLGFQDLVRKL